MLFQLPLYRWFCVGEQF